MVKLDVSLLRFLEDEDFRVLTALEMALRNHDVAPTVLIERIAQLSHGGCRKRLLNMLKHKMIHHESTMYDGYAMKYMAYDFLALRTFSKRGSVLGVGCRIGCGKESDIMLVQDANGNDAVLKLQRLGRTSFRSVARNRDYKGNLKQRRGASWFYLSRLAAQKEFAFMKVLYDEGFPVPKPIDHNRHAIVMEYIGATLLNNIEKMAHAQRVYERCLELVVKLARYGLVHGDFNEFNLFVRDDYHIIMIDFPQMVSIDHPNAAELFDRDIQNLATFFERRFGLKQTLFPKLDTDVERVAELDRSLMASGFFSRHQQRELEHMIALEAEEQDEEDASSDADDGAFEGDAAAARAAGIVLLDRPQTNDATDDATDDTVAAAAVASAQANAESDDTGSDEEESDEEAEPSEVATTTMTRRTLNPNILASGNINMEHVKRRVQAQLRREEDSSFHRSMHRNSMKGKEKRRMKTHIKTAFGGGGTLQDW